MIRLAAFADEISPDLHEQIAVLREEGIGFVELRSMWNTNVLDLTNAQVSTIRTAFDVHGIRVAAIGSPLGKEPADRPLADVLQRLARAIELAHHFETRLIRIFSFYPPEADTSDYREAVILRMSALAKEAGRARMMLVHENDVGLYGDTIERCLDVLQSVAQPSLAAALDPANFLLSDEEPVESYERLRPWIAHVHVKDVRSDRSLAPAGEGDANWPELLRRLRAGGYDGVFSLEPHLVAGGPYGGFSGADLFRVAARRFRDLLHAAEWQFE
jgi:sugar phosphate isomerase/epimerase